MATLENRIAELEKRIVKTDIKVIIISWAESDDDDSIIRAKCGDWSIDRLPSESEDEFTERASTEVRKLPRDSRNAICVWLDRGKFNQLEAG